MWAAKSLVIALAAVLAVLALGQVPDVRAQMVSAPPTREAPLPTLPSELTPEMVDQMLARLTDGQIRALLRAELAERAAQTADVEDAVTLAAAANARMTRLISTVATRVVRWMDAVANLSERLPTVRERLATAERGLAGMLGAALFVIVSGIGAALAIAAITMKWRLWLALRSAGYWEKVVRTVALGVLQYLPIAGFVVATRLSAALVGPLLGPLNDMVWIYHAGISSAWTFLMIAQRAFAPDAPAIRIAPMDDDGACKLSALLRGVVIVATAGWLVGGLFPTLGFGFAPALLTVAAVGTVVAGILMGAVIKNLGQIREVLAAALDTGAPHRGALRRIVVLAAPYVLLGYIVAAFVYWLALWLEQGQHHLAGPIGLLVILIVAPIIIRMGRETVATAIAPTSARMVRVREALCSSWRAIVVVAAGLIGLRLWGLDIVALAEGPDAPAWASAIFEILLTLLLGSIVWRLLRAALHSEERTSHGAEDTEGVESATPTRLDTLTPVFRKLLLTCLAVVVVMIVLSSLGVDIGPLLASAGIIGIAVGFGAQTLVRDIFSGIFFLLDDAFRVGEYIELDAETRGEVEAISIRSLQLRHHRGAVITIPFGEMRQITNHNRDWVIYKMSFRLEPDTDPQHVKKVVKRVAAELSADAEHGPKFIEPPKSQGVYGIDDDSALIIRVKFMCQPRAQFVLRREVYHRLQTSFAQEGVKFARRKVEVVSTPGQSPGDAAISAQAAAGALDAGGQQRV